MGMIATHRYFHKHHCPYFIRRQVHSWGWLENVTRSLLLQFTTCAHFYQRLYFSLAVQISNLGQFWGQISNLLANLKSFHISLPTHSILITRNPGLRGLKALNKSFRFAQFRSLCKQYRSSWWANMVSFRSQIWDLRFERFVIWTTQYFSHFLTIHLAIRLSDQF